MPDFMTQQTGKLSFALRHAEDVRLDDKVDAITLTQFDALVDLDVNMIQGFFVSPAVPAEDAENLLERTADSPNQLEKILSDRIEGHATSPPKSSSAG